MTRILIYCFLLLPMFTRSQDFTSQFPLHEQTQYFEFYYLHDSPRIQNIARFADGYVRLVNREFFKADFEYPIRVLVFADRPHFKQFLVEKLNIADPPNFGVYVYRYKFFATYEDSGLGTFAHEILHPLVERNLPDRPEWAMEGIPTFFEKFYGYWTNGEIVAYWGYQNPWRIQQLGDNLTSLDLKRVIADTERIQASSAVERTESSWRMVSVFLWQQGRFKRFLNLVAMRDKAGYPTYFEAAMQMPIEKILPLWQVYLDSVAEHRATILQLPASTLLDNQNQFEEFATAHGISLAQSENGK